MNYTKRCIIRNICMAVLLCCICLPDTAYGEEIPNNFVLTGVHTDGFYLTSNNHKIFDVEDIVPGDEIHAVIEAKNTTEEALDLALRSIDSLMYDTSLFDVLELTITYDGQVLYDGEFNSKATSVTEYITVDPKEQIALDVSVSVPKELNNAYQGMEMESAWVFEAKHPGNEAVEHNSSHDSNENSNQVTSPEDKGNQSGVKTGAELPGCDNTAAIFAVVGVIFIALGLYLILKPSKKKIEHGKKTNY